MAPRPAAYLYAANRRSRPGARGDAAGGPRDTGESRIAWILVSRRRKVLARRKSTWNRRRSLRQDLSVPAAILRDAGAMPGQGI